MLGPSVGTVCKVGAVGLVMEAGGVEGVGIGRVTSEARTPEGTDNGLGALMGKGCRAAWGGAATTTAGGSRVAGFLAIGCGSRGSGSQFATLCI